MILAEQPDQDDVASNSDRPSHHVVHPITGTLTFRNPWPSASAPSATELLFGGAWLGWPKLHLDKHPKARELQVLDPGDWGRQKVKELKREGESQGKGNKVGFARGTWLGHAAVYVQLPLDVPADPLSAIRRKSEKAEADESKVRRGRNEKIEGAVDEEDQYAEDEETTLKLLFDPIFSERAGPTSYTGPGRLRPAPCKVEDLPGVDAVLISHNHYDHLDLNSVKGVLEKWPRVKLFVPLGNKQWFYACGVPLSQIYECDWWDDVDLTPSDFGLVPPPLHVASAQSSVYGDGQSGRTSRSMSMSAPRETERIRVTCRSPTDQGSTLWCGWVVEHLLESDAPDPPFLDSNGKKASSVTMSTESFVSAPDPDEAEPFMGAGSTLVEEPEEEHGANFAVDETWDGEAEAAVSNGRKPRVQLVPPSDPNSPALTPITSPISASDVSEYTEASASSISLFASQISTTGDVSPSRRGSMTQLPQRSSSFSQTLRRRLSSASRGNEGTDRLTARTPSFSAPPLSRSSSLRLARDRQREREATSASTSGASTPGDGEDGSGQTPLLAEPAAEKTAEEVEEERRAKAEEKAREVAAKAERAEKEAGRAVHEGRWTKRVWRKGAVYHAGDTGYRRHRRAAHPVCPAFDEIGLKYGPLDLAFVPIWRGGSLGFVSAIGLRLHHENISSAVHGSPADAVDLHLDVRSRNTIGMHFGTFIGSETESLEAIIELHEAVEEAGVKALDDPNEDELGRMGVIDIGETCIVFHQQ
ncbi:hypothetical protein JCM10295v2_003653 [Rhodotorula toruloides]